MTPNIDVPAASIFAAHRLALVFLFFTVESFGQDSDLRRKLAEAAAIENSIERLAAFDDVAVRFGLVEQVETDVGGSGKWSVRRAVSPMDDSKTLRVLLFSENKVNTSGGSGRLSLIVRYLEGDLDAFVNFNNFMGSDPIRCTLRFDSEEAFEETLDISTDSTGGFFRGSVWEFLEKLSNSKRLLIRALPYNSNPITAEFDVSGFEAHLQEFEQTVTGWGSRESERERKAAAIRTEALAWETPARVYLAELRSDHSRNRMDEWIDIARRHLKERPSSADETLVRELTDAIFKAL